MKQKAEQQTLQGMEMYKCSFAVYLLVFCCCLLSSACICAEIISFRSSTNQLLGASDSPLQPLTANTYKNFMAIVSVVNRENYHCIEFSCGQ